MNRAQHFTKHSLLTRLLHWLVAVGIITLLAIGIWMVKYEKWGLYDWHKSLGILLMIVIVGRLLFRLRKGWLPAESTHKRVEQKLARFAQVLLLVGTVLMPLTGMLYSYLSGHGFGVFGLNLAPSHHDVNDPSVVVPVNQTLESLAHLWHRYIGYGLIGVIALHLGGALKHHIIDKDKTLKKMI